MTPRPKTSPGRKHTPEQERRIATGYTHLRVTVDVKERLERIRNRYELVSIDDLLHNLLNLYRAAAAAGRDGAMYTGSGGTDAT